MKEMIKAIIELELVYPYSGSIHILHEFNNLWSCVLLQGGTRKEKAIISMPQKTFKTIFGVNPIAGQYDVPRGMEKFISSFKVKKIKVD